MQRRRYKNPPIEEALCEFRFHPDQEWNLTIPGKLHGELADEYSGKPQEQKVASITLNAQEGQPARFSFDEGSARTQLVTEDGKRLVGIGKDVLSVHMLRPYQDPLRQEEGGWNEFRPRIVEALAAYWKVMQPRGVNRVGIRYVNRIIIPQRLVRIESYLKSALPNVSGLPDRLTSFMSRVEYSYEDGVRLVLSQGPTDAPEAHVGLLLDLDVIWEASEWVGQAEAVARADDLRAREREAFEAVVTDEARELFDAD